jgi:hypothetical protein
MESEDLHTVPKINERIIYYQLTTPVLILHTSYTLNAPLKCKCQQGLAPERQCFKLILFSALAILFFSVKRKLFRSALNFLVESANATIGFD